MRDLIGACFLLFGSVFMLLAAVGVVRMPDLLTRMQAATKASTLGVSCTLMAVIIHFHELGVTSRALLVIGFVFLTAPVAAHVLAKAALELGVALWPGTVRKDSEGQPQDTQPVTPGMGRASAEDRSKLCI